MEAGEVATAALDDVATALKAAACDLRATVISLQHSRERDARSLCAFNAGRYAATELDRAAAWVHDPCDLLAWCARKLFELHVNIERALASEEALTNWQNEFAEDFKQIREGFLTLTPILPTGAVQRLRREIDGIKTLRTKHSLPARSEDAAIRKAAEAIGRTEEYRTVYPLLCKFVHASSWRVNGSPEAMDGDATRRWLAGLALALGNRLRRDIQKAFDLAESSQREPKHDDRLAWPCTSFDERGMSIAKVQEGIELMRPLMDQHVARWTASGPHSAAVGTDVEAIELSSFLAYLQQRFALPRWPRLLEASAQLFGAAEMLRKTLELSSTSSLLGHEQGLSHDLGSDRFTELRTAGNRLDFPAARDLAVGVGRDL